MWATQYLVLVSWKLDFCVGFEGVQFWPAKEVYYVRRFQLSQMNIIINLNFYCFGAQRNHPRGWCNVGSPMYIDRCRKWSWFIWIVSWNLLQVICRLDRKICSFIQTFARVWNDLPEEIKIKCWRIISVDYKTAEYIECWEHFSKGGMLIAHLYRWWKLALFGINEIEKKL